jgi:hypothetical protein
MVAHGALNANICYPWPINRTIQKRRLPIRTDIRNAEAGASNPARTINTTLLCISKSTAV